MSQGIAFFDFDGTITTRDTLLEIIKYRHGRARFYLGFLLHSPWLVAYKLGFISNQQAKEKILRFFFGRIPAEDFRRLANDFSLKVIPSLVRASALSEIKKLQQEGFEVVIVSASAEDWLREWCNFMGVNLIATQLEVKDGLITGRINGLNCHGEEKVRRIQSHYQLSHYRSVICYGDTGGDKPMLEMGNIRFYKPFR